jgi:hypothetical protein
MGRISSGYLPIRVAATPLRHGGAMIGDGPNHGRRGAAFADHRPWCRLWRANAASNHCPNHGGVAAARSANTGCCYAPTAWWRDDWRWCRDVPLGRLFCGRAGGHHCPNHGRSSSEICQYGLLLDGGRSSSGYLPIRVAATPLRHGGAMIGDGVETPRWGVFSVA